MNAPLRYLVIALGALGLLPAPGCSSKQKAKGDAGTCDGDEQTCLTDHYLHGYEPSSLSPCATATKQRVNGRKELRFSLGTEVEDIEAVTSGQRLQRYYERYGLEFFVREAPVTVKQQYLFAGTDLEVRAHCKEVGVDPDVEPKDTKEEAALEKAIMDVVAKPLREAIAAGNAPGVDRVNIVILERITDPAVDKLVEGVGSGVTLGVGMSPKLIDKVLAAEPDYDLYAIYGLPKGFTPTFFIGQDDVRKYTPITGDEVLAHELGHALGLEHVGDPENLMFPVADSAMCQRGLSDAQVAELKAGTQPNDGGDATTTTKAADPLGLRLFARRYAAGLRRQSQ